MTDKLPWMPFYGSDFYHDEAVRLMSLEEEAVYLRLLWWQWREGSLPADQEHLAKVAGAAVSAHVVARFPVTRDSDGRRRNPRLELVRQEQLALIEARSRAGRIGRQKQIQARADAESNTGRAKPGQSPGKARAKRGHSESDTNNNTATWLTPFADAWQAKCGNPPYARLAKILAPLRQSLGEPEAVARWSRYLTATEPRYCSPERFVATHAAYAGPETCDMTDDYGRMVKHRKNEAGEWVPVVSVA